MPEENNSKTRDGLSVIADMDLSTKVNVTAYDYVYQPINRVYPELKPLVTTMPPFLCNLIKLTVFKHNGLEWVMSAASTNNTLKHHRTA